MTLYALAVTIAIAMATTNVTANASRSGQIAASPLPFHGACLVAFSL